MSPFDFLNSINQTKIDLFDDPENEKSYVPFMVNRGLSYFPDTIFHSNEMNKYSGSPKDWQYSFYLNAIPKRKRYSAWAKKDKQSDDIALLISLYGYSIKRALEAIDLLTSEQLKELRQSYATGGR